MGDSFYQKFVKRSIDFIFSLFLIVALSPVMLIISLLIFIFLGRPILFKQERPGFQEKIFILYKFRTMRISRDQDSNDEKRLTRLGNLLRSLSLDELPQLINIFKGDMSFIGPRPLLVKYLPLYNEIQQKRHRVRPGLTGLAQVNGRNALTWNEKFQYDLKYVESVTLIQDIKILFKTVIVILKRVGISSKSSVTMEEFKGNE